MAKVERAAIVWAAVVVGIGSLACAPDDVFECASDQQCGGEGVCESTGFCSFPDATCASGRRYGALSGAFAGECVGEAPDTDATSTTPASTSSTDDPPIEESSESVGPPVSASGSSSSDGEASTSTTTTPDTTTDDATTTVPIERVADGIVVLYTFDGEGEIVEDVSGVDPPIDLTILGEGYEWTDAGLAKSNTDGILLAEGSATKILEACQATSEITLEAWITPAEVLPLPSPVRVMGYSLDTQHRNFSLGQSDSVELTNEDVPAWVVRLRTSTTDLNGFPETVYATKVALVTTHLVFVHASNGDERIYIDTVEVASSTRTGTFDNWDANTTTYHFALGNELTLNRSWNGVFHLAAVYDRALAAAEIEQNYEAGF
jgi:hypothetical protein